MRIYFQGMLQSNCRGKGSGTGEGCNTPIKPTGYCPLRLGSRSTLVFAANFHPHSCVSGINFSVDHPFLNCLKSNTLNFDVFFFRNYLMDDFVLNDACTIADPSAYGCSDLPVDGL